MTSFPRISVPVPIAALALVAFATAGCVDRATAPDPVPNAATVRALADVTTDAEIEAAGVSGKPGSIAIGLDLQPDGSVDIPFTTTGRKLHDFTLDEDRKSVV